MNSTDANATAYVETFWADKPEPIKNMIRLAYIAGTHDFRGQAAIAAMQSLVNSSEIVDGPTFARLAVACADALDAELQEVEKLTFKSR